MIWNSVYRTILGHSTPHPRLADISPCSGTTSPDCLELLQMLGLADLLPDTDHAPAADG